MHLFSCPRPDPLAESKVGLQYAGDIAGISAEQDKTYHGTCVPKYIFLNVLILGLFTLQNCTFCFKIVRKCKRVQKHFRVVKSGSNMDTYL